MQSALRYRNILVAVDFSDPSKAALQQAVWVARRSGARIVLAHAFPDLKEVVHVASTAAKLDLLQGEGKKFEHEIEKIAKARLRQMTDSIDISGLDVDYATLFGRPYVEIPYAVERDKYDLVIAGTRGHGQFAQIFLGSTAKRLIRRCPCSVWVAKAEHVGPPQVVLAATDFSEVSRHAVLEGLAIAREAGAAIHLVNVIESPEVPDEVIERLPEAKADREKMVEAAQTAMKEFLQLLGDDASTIQVHQTTAVPWDEMRRLVQELNVDLVAIGTVGRTGIPGLLLGNTAEKVLDTCDASILTVTGPAVVLPSTTDG